MTDEDTRPYVLVKILQNGDGTIGLQIMSDPPFPPPLDGGKLTLIQAVGVKLIGEAKKFLTDKEEETIQ